MRHIAWICQLARQSFAHWELSCSFALPLQHFENVADNFKIILPPSALGYYDCAIHFVPPFPALFVWKRFRGLRDSIDCLLVKLLQAIRLYASRADRQVVRFVRGN